MFSKILIANRGEIACRIIHTARKMGVKTVAVYSDADRGALHVVSADEAVHIGPSVASESYLDGAKIIAAAQQTGAEAIHPGYGFLSENPDFVDDVVAAGLVFIGPAASSIRAMGLKDAAKALMVKAGVPVVPGYHGDNQDAAFLAAEADKIGYPVLIKARAGGGGKGMRLVERPADFTSALESAAREGQSAFGDAAVLVEKYITSPRHIEVQVFGDGFGNVVHLFERDCSLQRRHQKVIEEAPAPGMTAAVRKAMTDAAVTAAKAIDYQGAGTIEFIVDGAGDLRPDGFWFMEMNTRLQVEHPVTEAITSTDLVAWQLRVAAGEQLPQMQDDITLTGHAFEARLYAEDPATGFLPAMGRIHHIGFGRARIDTGVRSGDQISPFYDPMIAKLITHGSTRTEALSALTNALTSTHVAGLTTNASFLAALSQQPEFVAGQVDTGLIARELDTLTAPEQMDDRAIALAAVALSGVNFDASYLGWRVWGVGSTHVQMLAGDESVSATLVFKSSNEIAVTFEEKSVVLSDITQTDSTLSATIDGHLLTASTVLIEEPTQTTLSILFEGATQLLYRCNPLMTDSIAGQSGDAVTAPMTGSVRRVDAKAGNKVTAGDPVIVLEAMKMEHTLTAPRDGEIADVVCAVGDQVVDGMVLLQLVSEDEDD